MMKWRKQTKGKVALFLAVLTVSMVTVPYLPVNLLDVWGFKIHINTNYDPNGPYITGRIEGELRDTELLCLNKGAPANHTMDYKKVTADVNYSEGTLEQKRLFWAYIGAFGSADGDDSFQKYRYTPNLTKDQARKVAWKLADNAWVNMMANDGFMNLENVPTGCKSPQDIFTLVSKYDTPEKAMSINAIRSEPGVFSKEKLYEMMGLADLAAFEKYCTFEYYAPPGYTVVKTETSTTLHFNVVREDGVLIAVGEAPGFTIKVKYDPAYFKVVKVNGRLEKYTAVSGNRADEAQVLMRAVGKVEEAYPEFYMTTGDGYIPTPGTPDGGSGGNRGDSGEISYVVYEHKETFESNYKVDLKKYDYETGHPLKDSTWQVLEAFPDQNKLEQNENGGNLMEKNMREAPTTWEDWLVFDDDLMTDEDGYISHADKRYYDFDHAYCNGHPIPPEPESDGGEGEDDDEYEQLMEEWQEKVDECQAKSSASNGTLHHWLCGSESEPSESEAFGNSGCKAVRDLAYDNFINLRYSYTFRETDARDGYIIHGQNGHPDDVPVEIITTASSEADQEAEWTKASNEDIKVSGYLRNRIARENRKAEENDSGDEGTATIQYRTGFIRENMDSATPGNMRKMYLTEHYDLPAGEKAVNLLHSFFGLPDAFISEHSFAVNIVADDDIRVATASDLDEEEDSEEDDLSEIPLVNDLITETATDSNAAGTKRFTQATSSNAASPAVYQYSSSRPDRKHLYGAEDEPGLTGYGMGNYETDPEGFGDTSLDIQPGVTEGPHDNLAHTFHVYDHRVPGQIHFNKRDMGLTAGENKDYSAYGDTQGDATLEGAVYGLFAADDIYGPDTQRAADGSVQKGSGIIFDANDLVAVAVTDKNGDGSFLTITEKPHSTYNYKTGQIEYSGKSYPKNLYDSDIYRKANANEAKGRIYTDCLGVNGDYWIGRPLILGNYYIKELSRSEGYELSVTGKDMAVTNADEATRDDYGETESSMSHPVGSAWVYRQLSHIVTFPEQLKEFGNRENLFEFSIGSNDTAEGYNVVIDGIPDGADLYFNDVTINTVKKNVVIGHEWADAAEEPLYETAKDAAIYKKDAAGNRILNPSAVADIPRAAHVYASTADKLEPGRAATATDPARYQSAFTGEDDNLRYVKCELEGMMRQLGMETPKGTNYSTEDKPVYDEARNGDYGNPEVTITVTNVSTNASLIQAILDYFQAQKVFTYGSLQAVTLTGDTAVVKLAVSMTPDKLAMVETDDSGTPVAGYLFKLNETTGRYILRKYTGDHFMVMRQMTGGRYEVQMSPDYTVDESGMPLDVMDHASELDQYLHYETGDILYEYWSADGSTGYNPVRRRVYQPIYEEQDVEENATSTSQVPQVASREEAADPVGSTYFYYDAVSGQYTLHVGTNDADLGGTKVSAFTVAIPDGSTIITADDIAKIGPNNVWGYKEGDSLNNSEYIRRITGAGVSVYTGTVFDQDKTFIKNQNLIYNGNHDLREDGNTDANPNPLTERIISQQIKVTKSIDTSSYNNTSSYAEVHEDWWTKLFGGLAGQDKRAAKMADFRFKTYLKSNLERLYRDEDGTVTWQDRKGGELDVLEANRIFPARVSKIYTKVPHATTPLYQDSRDALIANTELYSYSDGLIHEDQNSGYTAILETVDRLAEDATGTRMVKDYNYDKFFDAIAAANHDKWDDAAPTYTSWQPIGNQINRTEDTIENAKASDMVRQFAIKWYLDDEVEKLVRDAAGSHTAKKDRAQEAIEQEYADGKVKYADELYDEALHRALQKSENYLKPFFTYDLDEIYAVEWDSAEHGGSDKDTTTLSADTLYGDTTDSGEGYYFGTSTYLPYGDYVVVEQQPRYADLEDFKNKHYQIDRPREVTLPAVYQDYDGSQASPEVLNEYYHYDAALSQPELERRYRIRFNEEDIRASGHIIRGRNAEGDFEVYKYGARIEQIQNGAPAVPDAGDYYALTQSEYRPYKNYYNAEDNRTNGIVPYYLSEGLNAKTSVSKYYRYSSVSEHAGTAGDVPFPSGNVTEENAPGIQYKDNVMTMHGIRTAYQGKYASMLVPWSIKASENSAEEVKDAENQTTGESFYKGFGYTKFRNRLYTAKLRIEKLDSETHENILHDGALFNIYAAKRDDSRDGNGEILFYDTDTTITGTREFLEAMGADHIQQIMRRSSWIDRLTGKEYGPGNLYSGVVPAGTPVCQEPEQIALGDSYGLQTVAFKAYSTVRDGKMKTEENNTGAEYQLQTVGYLETPQPLSAGCYVLCEVKAPSGYARTKPVAIEIYSDKVTYYKEGNRDSRILAALYEYESDHQTANGSKPQDTVNVARINVENQPVKLQVEKLKESSITTANTTADKTVTFKISGRVDGKLVDIGNNPSLVYAYENGDYLGYAWKKGTLEYLAGLRSAGEQVEIIYNGRNFAGYGYVTRTLETADDVNQYVAGATMALFEAIALNPSGDTEDHAYNGLVIERNDTNNITRMYVKEGYAGEKVDFVKEKDSDGQEITVEYQAGVDKDGEPIMETGNVWSAVTLQRHDTDILYYDLDSLAVTVSENVDGREILYGYDRDYGKVAIEQIESDKQNIEKTDTEHSIFAFKGGTPYLEFVDGDFTKIHYSPRDKVLEVGEGTLVYHLDRDGNRDALVDPYTGMAYVVETTPEGEEQVLVWSVNIRRDEYGNVIARDKITTSRIATVGENQDGYQEESTLDITNNSGHEIPGGERPSYRHTESGYITGSWRSDAGEESHKETSVNTNQAGQNMNDEVLSDDNNGAFEKSLNPVYDGHGLPEYYQRSEGTYDKSADLYDRNGDFVRQQDSDNLEEYNNAAYRINDHEELCDGAPLNAAESMRKPLYHRLGEGYILENTWITSAKTPNDPFQDQMTDGQPDILKRLPAGRYIMEELKAPEGYLKGLPVGISVREVPAAQQAGMVEKTTKILIDKVDGTEDCQTGRAGGYGFRTLPGAELALYEARRIYTDNTEKYPRGYYLEKKTEEPFSYTSTDSRRTAPEKLTAQWTTGTVPFYMEGIPVGCYVLEELNTPDGFVKSSPLEVEVANTPQVQTFIMNDDHTKVEVEKYFIDGTEKKLLSGAVFTLYEAMLDDDGDVVWEKGKPMYYEDRPVDNWMSGDGSEYAGFVPAFEAVYREYGTQPGTSVSWEADGKLRTASCLFVEQIDPSIDGGNTALYPTTAAMTWRTDGGQDIRICIYGENANAGGRDFTFEYQFDYRKLPHINAYANSYQTLEGRRRMDYLPVGGKYVLSETVVPDGFCKAEDQLVTVVDTGDIQRYHVENSEGKLVVSKTSRDKAGELAGAHLGLYRADGSGSFIQATEYLVEEWITGMDGIYTELDRINNRIPEGYAPGDLRPHEIRRLPEGSYYLAELESPSYYTLFEPVKLEYQQEDEVRIVRVTDIPAEGTLEIVKNDGAGRPLAGAVFELAAYRKSDQRNPVLTRSIGIPHGTAVVKGLPVGEVQEDGRIEPYLYKLKEQIPPDGYAVNTEVFRWQFAPDKNGVSFAFGEQAEEKVTVANQKTRVEITKKDFDALGDDNGESAFVEGARLAVYELTGRDDEDGLIYDKDRPVDTWTTEQSGKAHVLEGLIAGRSYLLEEQEAPAGYHIMKPVIFTLSADGRKIADMSNRLSTVTVNYITAAENQENIEVLDLDSIQSVTLKGRYAVKVYHTQETEESNTFTEKTVYSDGAELITGRVTGMPPSEKDTEDTGANLLPVRRVTDVTLAMEFADGTPVAEFHPGEAMTETTIHNNTAPENPRILMYNPGTSPGEALDPGQAVLNTVTYVNLSNAAADMRLTIHLDSGTNVLDGGGGIQYNGGFQNKSQVQAGGVLVFDLKDIKPLQSGSVTFATEVGGTSSRISASLKYNGNTVITEKEVPVLQPGELTLYHEVTGSGKNLCGDETEEFEIRLFADNGEELRGSYPYWGNGGTGTVHSGDRLSLKGNRFVHIDPEPYRNARFQITRLRDNTVLSSGKIQDSGACAVFSREVSDTSERVLFKKGESYRVREYTTFDNGEVQETNRLAFTLNEDGAVSQITAADRKTDVSISKKDLTDGEELPGCHMSLTDESGNLLDSWISGKEPHRILGELEPGGTYFLREERPAEGYAYASEIRFTVNRDGTPEKVIMADGLTRVQVQKLDGDTKEPLQGAEFQILDRDGNVVDIWISGTVPHELKGILTADETYLLREIRTPYGYLPLEDIWFTVPHGREIFTVVCENRRKPYTPKPGEPDHPAPDTPKTDVPEKIGRITAVYIPESPKAGGWLIFGPDGSIMIPLPGTGDASERLMYGWIMLLSILGICILKKKKRDGGPE
ncbi:SpaA isopeptide-forming pilin-related protein [Clostridium sp. AN503]|uniref:SpaA isopeptide-forming pilin-related protein n=1 Tax=Clostridium sp. AN503 TaxID=3160598 RepID=UPI0034584279